MDGVHDLGGKQGFGAIPNKDDALPFHEEWETRAFGIEQSSGGDSDWTIDWFRHCRELIPPVDYLTRPYFDQWATIVAAQMIDAGYITLDELRVGEAAFSIEPGTPPATAKEARAFVSYPKSYVADVEAAPTFAVGDEIRARLDGHSGHTRLPSYVRGKRGLIVAHHGGHVFPDASARSERRGEHLYTVSFVASELWREAQGRRDKVLVDLWESYLEHP